MNNNQTNYNPNLGQPINNINPNVGMNPQPIYPNLEGTAQQQQPTQIPPQPVMPQPQIQPEYVNNKPNVDISKQMQNIPTVEQNPQTFMDNTQAANTIKKEEKKEGPNILFIVVLFAIIFAAIFLLFPYLLNILG